METSELNRCGCGGYGELKTHQMYRARPMYFVSCNHCGTRTVKFGTAMDAIETWNKAMSGTVAVVGDADGPKSSTIG